MFCLLSILVFELGFIWFILHFGWLESVNIWAQVGVILVASSPLLVAAGFLIRKRFSLKSAFVAFTMLALFMGFTMRPVYEARLARVPAKVLQDSGAGFKDSAPKFDSESDTRKPVIIAASKSNLPDWIARLMGDYALLPPKDEILQLEIKSEDQFLAFVEVADQLPNLMVVTLSTSIGSEIFEKHKGVFSRTSAVSMYFISYAQQGLLNLDYLEGNMNIENVVFFSSSNAPVLAARLEQTAIENLIFQGSSKTGSFDWNRILNSSTFQQLKALALSGHEFTNAEAQEISGLKNLKSLTLWSSTVSDFEFLNQMPNLTVLSVSFNVMTDHDLLEFPVPEGLKELTLRLPKTVSEEAIEEFKQSVPESCEFIHHPN